MKAIIIITLAAMFFISFFSAIAATWNRDAIIDQFVYWAISILIAILALWAVG